MRAFTHALNEVDDPKYFDEAVRACHGRCLAVSLPSSMLKLTRVGMTQASTDLPSSSALRTHDVNRAGPDAVKLIFSVGGY